jgi:hypothetical protein
MLLSTILLGLGLASAAPLEPRAVRTHTTIRLDQSPDGLTGSIYQTYLRMQAVNTVPTKVPLAYHNGDKPYV